MDGKKPDEMTGGAHGRAVVDTSSDGDAERDHKLACAEPRYSASALDEINGKLDLILSAQGLVYERNDDGAY